MPFKYYISQKQATWQSLIKIFIELKVIKFVRLRRVYRICWIFVTIFIRMIIATCSQPNELIAIVGFFFLTDNKRVMVNRIFTVKYQKEEYIIDKIKKGRVHKL